MRREHPAGPLALWAAVAGGALLAALIVARGAQPGGHELLLGAGLAVAGAGAVVLWHVRPATVFCAGLTLAVFSGSWGALGLPARIAPDRLLLVFALVAGVAAAPDGLRSVRAALGPAHAAFGAAAMCAVLSAVLAGTLVSGGFRLLDRFGLVAFAVFAAAPVLFGDRRARTLLLWTLVGLGGYLGATAIFEILGPRGLVFPRYIENPAYGVHFGRARGPFVEAATNGMALFTCGAAAVLAATGRHARPAARAVAAVVATLCVVGIVLTLQRTAWIGASAGLVAVLLSRAELRRWFAPAAVTALIVVAGLFAVFPSLAGKAQDRGANLVTVWDRQNLANAAVAMIEARPLTGFGWDRFVAASPEYFRQAPDIPLTAGGRIAHNAALANASEIGLPATTLWLLGLVLAVGGALRARVPQDAERWKDVLLATAVFAVALAMFTPLLQPWPLLALLTLAGVVRAQAAEAQAEAA